MVNARFYKFLFTFALSDTMLKCFLMIFLLGFNWATGYAIAAYCISHGLPAQSYMFWQSFGPFCVICAVAILKKTSIQYSWSEILYCAVCAVFGVVIPSYISYFSLQYIDMGVIILFANCTPFAIYIMALMLKIESFDISRMLTVGIATIAVVSIVFNDNLQNLWLHVQHARPVTLLFLLIIPLCYSLASVFINRYRVSLSYMSRSLGMLFFASLAFFPLALKHGIYLPDFNGNISYLLMLEIIISAIDTLLIFYIINNAGAVYYSLVNSITAVVGIMYNVFLYNRQYTSTVFLSVSFIILSIVVLSVLNVNIKSRGA
jgi:drug/metabolite transporter (DMT)-like permease